MEKIINLIMLIITGSIAYFGYGFIKNFEGVSIGIDGADTQKYCKYGRKEDGTCKTVFDNLEETKKDMDEQMDDFMDSWDFEDTVPWNYG